jgi:phosphohistidine phosphatase
MLNLSLIRHAKSDWSNFDGDDMSRPISSKGKKKTEKVLKFLEKKEKKILFKEIFCSPSRRTKETLKLLLNKVSNDPKIYYLEDLYHSSGINIFDTIMLHATLNRVLVVSHEPLLSTSIESFFSGSNNKYYQNAIEEYTTSAFFNVSFKCKEWNEIERSKAIINFYVKPKDL